MTVVGPTSVEEVSENAIKKNTAAGWWWCTPLVPALKAEQGISEFKDSLVN